AIAAVLYAFGAWLYDRRAGLVSAAFFTFFSTTAASGHTQGFDTDFVMVLPYTAGAYLLARACVERRAWFATAGGLLAGVAVQVNPKGMFDMVFFAALLVTVWLWLDIATSNDLSTDVVGLRLRSTLRLFGLG